MKSGVEIVAEISGNHNGSLARAKELIAAAKDCGADSVKIQTYTADTITMDFDGPGFRVDEEHPLWGGVKLYDLYKIAHTPWEWHPELFDYADTLGIEIFSTPFDVSAVKFLESLGVKKYKIASLETGDTQLLKKVAETEKPVFVSTGASTMEELRYCFSIFSSFPKTTLTFLLCVSSYPAALRDMNLSRIETLKEEFECRIGLSDHCISNKAAIGSVYMGAQVIEKHLTLDRQDGGVDSGFSLNPDEFKELVLQVREAEEIIGERGWHFLSSEKDSRELRKSLYIVQDVKEGDEINEINVRSIRPSGGMEPRFLEGAVGKKFNKDCKAGTPLSASLLAD